jgi:hypothetical protein
MLGFVIFPIVDYTDRALHGGAPTNALDAATAFAFGSAIAAGIITLVFAFPILAWRLNRGPFTLREVLWWGIGLGNLPLAIIAILSALNSGPPSSPSGSIIALRAMVAGSVFGLTGAATFWAIAVRGTDHDARVRISEGGPAS